jgi:hypothetical protein
MKIKFDNDYFETERKKMGYLFNRTTGDAQGHLQPRFEDETDGFQTLQEMFDHLTAIYDNPHKVRDARNSYHKLYIQSAQTFQKFHTKFLQLAGKGKVAVENYRDDLYDKITPDLQKMVLPTLASFETHQALAVQCRLLDAELKRIKQRTDRQERIDKTKTSSYRPATVPFSTSNLRPLPKATVPTVTDLPRPVTARTGLQANPAVTSRIQPQYDSARKRELSAKGACFVCEQTGHMANACPRAIKAIDRGSESGKDSP